MKQVLQVNDLMREFTLFLYGIRIKPSQSSFGRDVIIQCLGKQCITLLPPVPGILSDIEGENLRYLLGYKIGHFDRELASDAFDKEPKAVITKFRDYLKSLGYSFYILFSESFYNEQIDDEETKAFRLSIEEDLIQFIEEENLSLMVRDTI
ncbi:hypothetical protein [Desulfosporosinus nitroreducens]|uniref:hypothetical protein n=1 Tax=Desulfosporosinus nitroreducens TaxID=2018668 RepID=UPI00207CBD68|nr:hypothetical protein [Desulfosporosinus nitroreducens]MCO1603499.1 hypothetical protein [Desulfosporosinus nitroreducens]